MFAPKIAKPQTKAIENPPNRLALERSTRAGHGYDRGLTQQALFLQRTIGNQAALRLLAQASRPDREMGLENMAIPREGRGLSWSLSNIPVSPPELASQARPSFSPPSARSAGIIQKKLEIGAVDDPLEREADHVAEQVMRMPDAVAARPPAVTGDGFPGMQRKCSCGGACAECRGEQAGGEHGQRQRKSIGPRVSSLGSSRSSSGISAPATVHEVLNSPGQSLHSEARAFFEPRFAADFSHVRIHTDPGSAASAQSLAARAYTSNSHIVFGPGEYAPTTHSGRHLIAHELGHIMQQATASSAGLAVPRIQRQVVPPEQFARLIEEIDARLANPKLTDSERIEFLRKREEYFDYLRGLEDSQQVPASYRFTPPPSPASGPKATPKFQSPTHAPPAQPQRPPPSEKLKSVPSTGTIGSRAASAKALSGADAGKSVVPPPSTPYINTNAAPRNADERAKHAEEAGIGKQLNEMAVGGRLGDVKRVEGRRPVQGGSSDYQFHLKDGSTQSADLYSPKSSTSPENAALRSIKEKSAQGEVLVLHLVGIENPLEYAQRVADVLVVSPNHGLKKMIAFSENRLLISRSLTVDGKAIAKVQQRVAARLTAAAKTQSVSRPKQPSRSSAEPAKLTQAQVEQHRTQESVHEVKTMFAEGARQFEERARSSKKGLFYDPHAVNVESKTGTNMSTQGAVEGLGQMILGAQLDSVRSAEIQKAIDALNALQPQIETLRSTGFDVTVVVVAQVPKMPDLAAAVTGVGDAREVVYFQKMYIGDKILHVEPRTPTQPAPNNSHANEGPSISAGTPDPDRDSQWRYGPDRYEDPAWVNVMQENYEIFGSAGTYKPPMPGFRYQANTMVVPAD